MGTGNKHGLRLWQGTREHFAHIGLENGGSERGGVHRREKVADVVEKGCGDHLLVGTVSLDARHGLQRVFQAADLISPSASSKIIFFCGNASLARSRSILPPKKEVLLCFSCACLPSKEDVQ